MSSSRPLKPFPVRKIPLSTVEGEAGKLSEVCDFSEGGKERLHVDSRLYVYVRRNSESNFLPPDSQPKNFLCLLWRESQESYQWVAGSVTNATPCELSGTLRI